MGWGNCPKNPVTRPLLYFRAKPACSSSEVWMVFQILIHLHSDDNFFQMAEIPFGSIGTSKKGCIREIATAANTISFDEFGHFFESD